MISAIAAMPGAVTAEVGKPLARFDYLQHDGSLQDPQQVLELFRSPQDTASILQTPTPFNVGNGESEYWFHTRVRNDDSDSVSRRLIAVVPYRPLLYGYLIDADSEVSSLLAHTIEQPFTEREHIDGWRHRWLISPMFDIAAGDSVDILVRYGVSGSSYLPLDVVDELTLRWHMHNDTVSAVLFYSFSSAAILLFLLFGIAMRDRTAMLYAALFASALLTLSAMEGYAFMLLWPQSPSWNAHAALVLIYAFCAFGFYVADSAARSAISQAAASARLPSLVGRLLRIMVALSLVMLALVPVIPGWLATDLSNLFVILMFSAHAWALYRWSKTGDGRVLRRNLLTVISAALIAVLVLVLVILSFDPDLLPPYLLVHASRLIFILSGLAMMATVIAHVSGLRQDYAASLEQQVAAAQRQADMSRQLLEAEQRYTKVRALASLRQQQLAEASHDMKQPLVSLRSALDTLAEDQSGTVRQQLANAFAYLENLCNNYLRDSRPQQAEAHEQAPALEQAGEADQAYSVNLVLETVHRMFEADARDRQIELRMQPSSITVTTNPTVVIRIVSNIVSNAIKHSKAGRILVGVRRSAASIVIADDGRGMSQQELGRITQAYQKGPDSSGEGLGMAISRQLAEQHGMRLDITSEEGKGTCFCLSL